MSELMLLMSELDKKSVSRLTDEIRRLVRRSAADIVRIGRCLREVKELLPHGEFGSWLGSEFSWSERTAQNMMRVAEVFESQSETVAEMGDPESPSPLAEVNTSTRALYKLSSRSVPDSVRTELVERVLTGEPIAESDVSEAMERRKRKVEGFQLEIDHVRQPVTLSHQCPKCGFKY